MVKVPIELWEGGAMRSASVFWGRRLWGFFVLAIIGICGFLTAASADDKKDADAKKETDAAFAKSKQPFRYETGDGVKLVGDFYTHQEDNIAKPKSSPVVILLHAVGPGKAGASRKDWGKLPELLWKEGYSVLAFDFRGYGDSKDVAPAAYARIHGRQINKIEAKSFSSVEDYANLVSDVVAAKVWLDLQNNDGICNANNLAIIGAEQGTAVGLLFAANEFIDLDRGREFVKKKIPAQVQDYNPIFYGFSYWTGGPRVDPGMEIDVPTKYEGDDITCVVGLSMKPALGGFTLDKHIKAWMQRPLADNKTMLDKISLYGLYGEKDVASDTYWRAANSWLKGSGGGKQQSGYKVIKNTNLAGTKMLGSDALNTEEKIVEFLAQVFKPANASKVRREYKDKPSAPDPNPPLFKHQAAKFFFG